MNSCSPQEIRPKKLRNSSVELYRILATFAVLIVHFNGWFVDAPKPFDINAFTITDVGQIVIEAMTIICVNMFLIITGYFGLKLKLESLLRIAFLLVLIYIPFYLLNYYIGGTFVLKSFIGKFFVVTQAGYFVQCYVFLMFLSPVLNAFLSLDRKIVLRWTFAFIIVETWFDCFMGIECLGFSGGYAIMHFVLMYMIGRCLFIYKEELLRIRRSYWMFGYIACTLVIILMFVIGLKFSLYYSNPVTILSTCCSFMPFLYKNYHNTVINWIASSTLSVYIIQVTPPVYYKIVKLDMYLLTSLPYWHYLLALLVFVVLFFFVCVFYGKLCEMIYKPLVEVLMKKRIRIFQ